MAESQAYIFGAGGHARVIASLLDKPATFVTSESQPGAQMLISEFFDRIEELGRHNIYLGIGDNTVRRQFFDRLRDHGVKVATCMAPNAFVARDATIGEGAVLCPGSVVNSKATIGANTIVNTLSSIDHDCVLGDHTQVTAGVTIGGTVEVGTNCFFGIKSAVIPDVTIGNNVIVMAGALVTRSIPDSVMVGGTPARVMKSL